MKQTEILIHVTHVNGWEPAVYMSYMNQNFRLFHESNLSVRNFRIFLLMYPGSLFVFLLASLAVATGAGSGGGGGGWRGADEVRPEEASSGSGPRESQWFLESRCGWWLHVNNIADVSEDRTPNACGI